MKHIIHDSPAIKHHQHISQLIDELHYLGDEDYHDAHGYVRGWIDALRELRALPEKETTELSSRVRDEDLRRAAQQGN